MDIDMDRDKQNRAIKFDYVIFHRNCPDGFSAFVILTRTGRIARNATIFPDDPYAKVPPPNLEGKNVVIMDVAYKKSVLEEIFATARYVLFIDHHVTIRAGVLELTPLYAERHHVVYDVAKSGASLTWEYFFPGRRLPRFVRYIEDNDIGAWRYKYTLKFMLGFRVNYRFDLSRETLREWDRLFDNDEVTRLIKLGIKYSEYQEFLMDANSRRYSLESFPSDRVYHDFPGSFERPGQYRVAVVNGGCPDASLLGKRMAEEVDCDFVIIWTLNLDKKEYVLQFRSTEVDVGRIAEIFGGGGHKLASATSFPLSRYQITDLFFPQSLPRR